jgi:ADP-ribose pyrophosphatase YjhB (NUDIX family)
MKHATAIVFVLLLAGGAGLLVAAQRSHEAGARGSEAPSGGTRSGARSPEHGAGTADPGQALDPGEPPSLASSREATDETNADAGGVLLDGGAVPDLEAETPKSVVFGVILIQYAEAQGAPPGTRNRADAEKLASELVARAKTDFKAAVEKGDPGSTPNAGRMFRGVLEPAPEYVLFKLEKGEVSEPVDTPRGFWIVKRIE